MLSISEHISEDHLLSNLKTRPEPIVRYKQPRFSLKNDPAALEIKANLKQLTAVFPDTRSVAFDGHFLIFHVEKLPPRPWPSRIADIPIHVTTNETDSGPIGRLTKVRSSGSMRYLIHDDARNSPEKFARLVPFLINSLKKGQIRVGEIQYWEGFIVIVLRDKRQNMGVLPSSFARCPCHYIFERDMKTPRVRSIAPYQGPLTSSPPLGARTWMQVSAGTEKPYWIQARWEWNGQEGLDCCDKDPMRGWALRISSDGLKELLRSQDDEFRD